MSLGGIPEEIGRTTYRLGYGAIFAARDGNRITGQQNFSGGETAEAIIRALGE